MNTKQTKKKNYFHNGMTKVFEILSKSHSFLVVS
jgi:hypothetical protein